MKDKNLISIKNHRLKEETSGLLQFDSMEIKNLKQIVQLDAEFLSDLGFLDYSLLLAVEKIKNPVKPNYRDTYIRGMNFKSEIEESALENAKTRHRFKSTCGKYVYHIAIIDYLTQFNLSKRIESYYKVHIKN